MKSDLSQEGRALCDVMGACLTRDGEVRQESASSSRSGLGNGKQPKVVDPEQEATVIPERPELSQKLRAEAERDAELASVSSRIVLPGTLRQCSLHTMQGRKGWNQDTMLAWEEYLPLPDTTLVAVFDGHGPFGHLVAKRVRDSLPSCITEKWKEADTARDSANSVCTGEHGKIKQNETVEEDGCEDQGVSTMEKWQAILSPAFAEMECEVRQHPSIDPVISGTTAVLALQQGEDLVVANVGDSRCVLALEADKSKTCTALQITVDHKCFLPAEKQRIERARGRVFALEDEPHIHRVWLPREHFPGLAMSRSLGDALLKGHGVLAQPEVFVHRLQGEERFAILASDGVFDVMTNQEAVDIVAAAATRAEAALSLVDSAVAKWAEKFPDARRDDCTAAILFFDHRGTPEAHSGNGLDSYPPAPQP